MAVVIVGLFDMVLILSPDCWQSRIFCLPDGQKGNAVEKIDPIDYFSINNRLRRSMYLPTIRQLQYLVAVVDLNHFGRAAERCNVTQSTLSAGVAELENLLQAQLIERTKRRVQVTPLGEEIAEKARALLDAAADIAETARAAEAPLSGRFRMGVIPTIGPFVLPRVLARLRNAYPDLKLYLREGQTENLIYQLRRGELETALIALPYDTGDLESLQLGPDPLWVVLPEGHRLAQAGT
ncbi:MAG: LysR substrate-binding domain-containing protein, partial [Pseudomonadota bacterium]